MLTSSKTDSAHCIGPSWAPCQQGFGLCEIVNPTTCGVDSGTTAGRTIGYYQGANVRNRPCMQVTPSDINVTGYTHLYYAFAGIDPSSFNVVAEDPSDIDLYIEFTALQSSSLQTWIAIGGFDFSDAGTTTHTTWYDSFALQSSFLTRILGVTWYLPQQIEPPSFLRYSRS